MAHPSRSRSDQSRRQRQQRWAAKPPSDFTVSEDFLTRLKNPRWNDAAQTSILLDGVYDDEPSTFLASPNDLEEYGVEVYLNARAGVYGPIASFQPPALTQDDLEYYASNKAGERLATARDYSIEGLGVIRCAVGPEKSALNQLEIWGSHNPTATTTWTDDAYQPWTLTGEQAVAFWSATFDYQQSVAAVVAQIFKDIASGEITATAQIDNVLWPRE